MITERVAMDSNVLFHLPHTAHGRLQRPERNLVLKRFFMSLLEISSCACKIAAGLKVRAKRLAWRLPAASR